MRNEMKEMKTQLNNKSGGTYKTTKTGIATIFTHNKRDYELFTAKFLNYLAINNMTDIQHKNNFFMSCFDEQSFSRIISVNVTEEPYRFASIAGFIDLLRTNFVPEAAS